MLTAPLRTILLTSHVTTSVGWLGAVLAFLALSVAAVVGSELPTTRGAYVAMNLIGWAAIIPLAVASFLSGVALALGTEWGLLRHRWVVIKLVATTLMLIGLILHQTTAVSLAAELANRLEVTAQAVAPQLSQLGGRLIIDAGFAVVFLGGLTALSLVKPWGRVSVGHSRVIATTSSSPSRQERAAPRRMVMILIVLAAALVLAFVVLHLLGGGMAHHHQ